jgi:surface carbohydrate biosynthesis protein
VRKLSHVSKIKSEVLIIDELLSNWVMQCIPRYCKCTIVKNRDCIPYIRTISFFFKLIGYTVRFGFTNKSLLLAIIGELKPKVVITFIDNNVLSQGLFRVLPEIRFVSIQNGVRGIRSLGRHKVDYDNYYGFGLFEKELFLSAGVSFVNYQALGSVKLGLFLSRYNYFPYKEKKNTTICFVSQYRKKMSNNGINLDYQFVEMSKELYRLTVMYALSNECNVNVALTYNVLDSDYSSEKNYFEKIISADIVRYFDNDQDNMTSYQVAIESDLIISMDSTLLMEMFGCKKRVVWGINSKFELAKWRGGEAYKRHMPSELILDSLDKILFKKKLDDLLLMNDKKYIDLTKKSREYFINSERPYPHETIKQDIDKYLNSFV